MEYPIEYSPLRPGGTPLTRRLLALGGELEGRRVLDLGCGRGVTADLLRQEYGALVTGTDLSAGMIGECSEKYPGITFLNADAQELPFADCSFDVLVSECCFSVFQDPEKAFKEAERVLVPGGVILLSDLWKHGEVPGGNGMVRSLYSQEEWQDMIAGAGFVLKDFIDVREVLTEMYVQMIFDLGLEGADRMTGLCLTREEMKNVSYMLACGRKQKA